MAAWDDAMVLKFTNRRYNLNRGYATGMMKTVVVRTPSRPRRIYNLSKEDTSSLSIILNDPEVDGYFTINVADYVADNLIPSIDPPGVRIYGRVVVYPLGYLPITVMPNSDTATWTNGYEDMFPPLPIPMTMEDLNESIIHLLSSSILIGDSVLDNIMIGAGSISELHSSSIYLEDGQIVSSYAGPAGNFHPLEPLLGLINNNYKMGAFISYSYRLPPGRLEYDDLLRQCPDADDFILGNGNGRVSWSGIITDGNKEKALRLGICDEYGDITEKVYLTIKYNTLSKFTSIGG